MALRRRRCQYRFGHIGAGDVGAGGGGTGGREIKGSPYTGVASDCPPEVDEEVGLPPMVDSRSRSEGGWIRCVKRGKSIDAF